MAPGLLPRPKKLAEKIGRSLSGLLLAVKNWPKKFRLAWTTTGFGQFEKNSTVFEIPVYLDRLQQTSLQILPMPPTTVRQLGQARNINDEGYYEVPQEGHVTMRFLWIASYVVAASIETLLSFLKVVSSSF